MFDKRDDFDFDIVNFPFLDGDIPRSTSYGVYISSVGKIVTCTRIRVRVMRMENTCSSKIYALKASNCLDKSFSSSNKLRHRRRKREAGGQPPPQ